MSCVSSKLLTGQPARIPQTFPRDLPIKMVHVHCHHPLPEQVRLVPDQAAGRQVHSPSLPRVSWSRHFRTLCALHRAEVQRRQGPRHRQGQGDLHTRHLCHGHGQCSEGVCISGTVHHQHGIQLGRSHDVISCCTSKLRVLALPIYRPASLRVIFYLSLAHISRVVVLSVLLCLFLVLTPFARISTKRKHLPHSLLVSFVAE